MKRKQWSAMQHDQRARQLDYWRILPQINWMVETGKSEREEVCRCRIRPRVGLQQGDSVVRWGRSWSAPGARMRRGLSLPHSPARRAPTGGFRGALGGGVGARPAREWEEVGRCCIRPRGGLTVSGLVPLDPGWVRLNRHAALVPQVIEMCN